MTIGFSIKSWDKLVIGDVILAVKDGDEVIGRVDAPATDNEVFLTERGGEPLVILKSDGWEIKLRKL